MNQSSDLPVPAKIIADFFGEMKIRVRPFGSGIVNETYLAEDPTGNKAILQKLSPVFDSQMIEDFQHITANLAGAGWEVPSIIPAPDGRLFITDQNGRLWRRLSFIESEPPKIGRYNRSMIAEMGDLLARLHSSLAAIEYRPKFKIAHFHNTAFFATKLTKNLNHLEGEAHELAQQVLADYQKLPEITASPPQLIHGDPQRSNILFRGNHPFTFIDFDTLMLAPIWTDIGDLLRSLVEDCLAQQTEFDTAGFKVLAEAYHLASKSKMPAEAFVESSLIATRAIALELAMRFLIDIVEDSYFAWDDQKYSSRAEHNLARAQLQWQIYQASFNQTKSSYKAIIFDFFDVIHSDHQKAWLAHNGYKREGGFAEVSDLLDKGYINRQTYFERYAQLSGRSIEQVEKEFEALSRVDQDVIDLIKQLKKHYRIGLLSNTNNEELEPLLKKYKLEPLFDEIIVSAEVKVAKPQPEIFQLMLDRLKMKPEECIFIDDNEHNVAAAEKMGIRGIVHTSFTSLKRNLSVIGLKIP